MMTIEMLTSDNFPGFRFEIEGMWVDIINVNAPEIPEELHCVIRELHENGYIVGYMVKGRR